MNILKYIKKYDILNPKFIIAFITLLSPTVYFIISALVYSYNLGYYSYFNVPSSYISFSISLKSISMLFLLFILILIFAFFIIFGLILRMTKQIKTYFIFSFVVVCILLYSFEIVYFEKSILFIFNDLINFLVTSFVLFIVFTNFIISLTVVDIYNNFKSKHSNKCISNKSTKKSKNSIMNLKQMLMLKIGYYCATAILTFTISIIGINYIGRDSAKKERSFYLVKNTKLLSKYNINFDSLLLIYENDKNTILMPYHINDDKLVINATNIIIANEKFSYVLKQIYSEIVEVDYKN